jgi:hypothetical protein
VLRVLQQAPRNGALAGGRPQRAKKITAEEARHRARYLDAGVSDLSCQRFAERHRAAFR